MWQPIETAPKDGSPVLLWRPTAWGGKGDINPGRWDDDQYAKRPKPHWASRTFMGKSWDRLCEPTHWQPLPEPPPTEPKE